MAGGRKRSGSVIAKLNEIEYVDETDLSQAAANDCTGEKANTTSQKHSDLRRESVFSPRIQLLSSRHVDHSGLVRRRR